MLIYTHTHYQAAYIHLSLIHHQPHHHRHHLLFQGLGSNTKTFRIPESSTATPTIRIVLNSLNPSPEPGQMPRQFLNQVTTPNPLQFTRAQIPPPQPPSPPQHNVAQSMNHFQIYEPNSNVFQQAPSMPSASNKPQFHFGMPQTQSLGWPQGAPPTSFHHSPPPAAPSAPPPPPKADTVKVARRSFPGTFPLPNPASSSSMPHERRFLGFSHGAQEGAQPPLMHPQSPVHGPPPALLHVPHQAPSSSHQMYGRPDESFYGEKSRKKLGFATTESPMLSAAHAHKTQQYIEFSCAGRRSGYYANRMYKCQVSCTICRVLFSATKVPRSGRIFR